MCSSDLNMTIPSQSGLPWGVINPYRLKVALDVEAFKAKEQGNNGFFYDPMDTYYNYYRQPQFNIEIKRMRIGESSEAYSFSYQDGSRIEANTISNANLIITRLNKNLQSTETFQVYTVQPGDTAIKIEDKFNMPRGSLDKFNRDITDRNKIYAGEQFYIPISKPDNNASAAPTNINLGANQFYVDTIHNDLNIISTVTGVPVADLVAANPGLSENMSIAPGTLVKLPSATNALILTPSTTTDSTSLPDAQSVSARWDKTQLNGNSNNNNSNSTATDLETQSILNDNPSAGLKLPEFVQENHWTADDSSIAPGSIGNTGLGSDELNRLAVVSANLSDIQDWNNQAATFGEHNPNPVPVVLPPLNAIAEGNKTELFGTPTFVINPYTPTQGKVDLNGNGQWIDDAPTGAPSSWVNTPPDWSNTSPDISDQPWWTNIPFFAPTPDSTPISILDPTPISIPDPTPISNTSPDISDQPWWTNIPIVTPTPDSTPISILDPTPISILDPTPISILDPTPISNTSPDISDQPWWTNIPFFTPIPDSTPISILDPTPISILDPTPISIFDSTPISIFDPTPIFDWTPAPSSTWVEPGYSLGFNSASQNINLSTLNVGSAYGGINNDTIISNFDWTPAPSHTWVEPGYSLGFNSASQNINLSTLNVGSAYGGINNDMIISNFDSNWFAGGAGEFLI